MEFVLALHSKKIRNAEETEQTQKATIKKTEQRLCAPVLLDEEEDDDDVTKEELL